MPKTNSEWLRERLPRLLALDRQEAGDDFTMEDSTQLLNLVEDLGQEKVVAFVQGAKWWEFTSTGGTMWQSDQEKAWEVAHSKALSDTLGKRHPITNSV
jgi:hypothetical protein